MNWIDEARKERDVQGEVKHGPINPLSDLRCFVNEALDELLDGVNYLQWAMEKGEINFCQWNEIDELVRMAIWGLKEGV